MLRDVRVLVVDDEESIRRMLRLCLEGAGARVTVAASGEAALAAARRAPPDVAMVDLRLGATDGIAVVRALLQEAPNCAVILMTAYATIDSAVEAMRAGALDYLPKPFTPAQVVHAVEKTIEDTRVRQELAEIKRTNARGLSVRFETKSPAAREAFAIAARVAPTDVTVLLLGDTGVGKGILARHIHATSPRRAAPFVTVNCAVIAPTLIETELFGHTKGAFTGAEVARAGHVEAAGAGTLFLDEVGDLSRDAQGKLLRLLEDHEYVRVGDHEPRRSDARVIAATHRDLRAAVAAGTFREDLYFRLNVVSIRLPALRERREDIVDLAQRLLAELAEQHRRAPSRAWNDAPSRAWNDAPARASNDAPSRAWNDAPARATNDAPLTLTPEARAALTAYSWPGNLRELVNVLERAVILASGDALTLDLLPDELRTAASAPRDDDESLEAVERRHIAAVLARHPTLESAARALGIDPSTLYRKRERFGLR
ncbi:MAG: sigma-54-dependent Fis family transcriptional regulator [Deltaproteobacteria bacterium]|nr:sigma-54-dependent Fis family transcriptional regulator [Deltaproteobacteria bacterium]